MKFFLILSLILNVVLAGWIFKQSQVKPIEKIIIEHQKSPESIPSLVAQNPDKFKKIKKKKNLKREGFPSEQEIQEVIEKVQLDREEFLMGELRLERAQIEKMKQIKEKAYKKMNEAYLHSQGVDSLETRRQVLEIEEKLYLELSQVIGDKKWKKFLKFRNEYNKQHLETNTSGAPVPFMDI